MKEFQPSDDFVTRVMRSIYDYEKGRQTEKVSLFSTFVSLEIFQYALPAGGFILGLWNLARFYFAVLAPVICW